MYKKNHYDVSMIAFLSVMIPFLMFFSGCASSPARRIDPTGPETITTVQGINIQDWQDAAAELSESLLASGILGTKGEPDLIAISSFVNNTSRHVDQDMLLKKIRTVLNKSGRAYTITTIGVGGETEDAIATEEKKKKMPF